ncbi:MAG: M3 family metallopeptidase, partial [Gammaproteobacteria bacterium]
LHEFGHLIHYHLRYHQPWLGISQPERDFMEAPSQMLEEWIYDTDTLRRFAVDDAGRPIPASLVERTRRARSLGEGLRIHWQLTLADLSLTLHGRASEDFDLDTLYDEVMTRNAIIPHLPEVRKYASFGHLGNPAYAASYYTYVWSQAIADDMATRFLKAGMRDRQTALIYRRIVLETGGARPAEEYVAEFLGRPFNLEALRRRIGTGTDEAH